MGRGDDRMYEAAPLYKSTPKTQFQNGNWYSAHIQSVVTVRPFQRKTVVVFPPKELKADV